MKPYHNCMKPRGGAIFATICALAIAPLAADAETWYWVGANKNGDNRLWHGLNNWTNANGVAGDPARGDTAVLRDNQYAPHTVCKSSGDDWNAASSSARVPLDGIIFDGNKKSCNQGNFAFICGGSGLKVLGSYGGVSHYTGMLLEGEGEVPIDIVEAGSEFRSQMRMSKRKDFDNKCNPTIVKKGAGTFVSFYQGGSRAYEIPLTKIQQGKFDVTTGKTLTDVEFRFDGNDGSARLKWGHGSYQLPLILGSGCAISESADVANTEHGFECTYNQQLQFTGTPSTNTMTFTGTFYGGAGLLWNPGSTDYSFVCSTAVSATTGNVEVASGTVKLTNGASFTALTSLKVDAAGVFEVEAGSGANFRAETLDVYTSSKLKLASGVTLTVGAVALNALPVKAGTYGSADGEGVKRAAWIEGDGTVVVETGSASSFSWVGGGADTGIATEGNWDPETPDLNSGDDFALFAQSGVAATLGSDAAFSGLSLQNGFAFSGTGTLGVGDLGIAALDAASATTYSFGAPLEAMANQTWAIGANNTFDVTGGLKGSGDVKVEGAGTLNLGSGAGYTGAIDIGTKATISGRNALGEAGAVARVRNDSGAICFSSATNDAAVSFYSAGAAADTNIQSFQGDNLFNGPVTNNMIKYELQDGATVEFAQRHSANVIRFKGNGNVVFRGREILSGSTGTMYIDDNVTIDFHAANNNLSAVFWTSFTKGCVRCHVPYAIQASGSTDGKGQRVNMSAPALIDLGGCDQSLDGLASNNGGTITSDDPAFFHWVAKNRYNDGNDPDTGNANRTNNVVFAGAAGLSYDGPQTNRLGGVSTTTGTLKVTNGKLIVLPHASWANCTNVVVSSGMLSVGNASAFADNVVVDISGGGKVDLDYDGMAKCDYLFIDGQRMPGGEYGSDDSSAGHKLPNFAGSGVLSVKKRSFIISVR